MGVQIVTTAFAAEHHQRQIHFIRSTHETKIVKKAAEMGGYRQRLCNRSVHHTAWLHPNGCRNSGTADNPRIPDSAIQSAVLSAAAKQIRLSGMETRRLK